MSQIVTYPDPVLRKQAEPVDKIDETTLSLLETMQQAMYADDGVGLAAPQIGMSKRIIVLDAGEGLINLINPEIVSINNVKETLEEGCLSLPDIRVNVSRPTQIVVEGLNEKGETVKYEADDLKARIIQHEVDHLNGKLILDYLSSIQRNLLRSKLKKLEKASLA